jgi:hypothetical protein
VSWVAKQIKDYHYIYPRAPNVSTSSLLDPRSLFCQTTNLVLHMRPYRNDRIIMILRDLYFSGGPKSFAARFDYHFPRFEERDGTTSCEVPAPMLALVATAVSQSSIGLHQHHDNHYISFTLPSMSGVMALTTRLILLLMHILISIGAITIRSKALRRGVRGPITA